MKTTTVGGAALALLLTGAVGVTGQHATESGARTPQIAARAHADIVGDGIAGTADLTEYIVGTGREVELVVTVSKLRPGLHGLHFHAVGQCEPPAFSSAGGHFDPGPFGNTDPDANHPFHMGDLPNLEAAKNGSARLTARTTRVTLTDGPLSVFDSDGTALIIHANPDQGVPGEPKSGVAGGPRIACGVLTKQELR
jgi:superoxide dismutase, Cu-Zn family